MQFGTQYRVLVIEVDVGQRSGGAGSGSEESGLRMDRYVFEVEFITHY